MSLLLVPATRENLEKSVEQSVDLEFAEKYLGDETVASLLRLSGHEGLRCWALTKNKKKLYESIESGDEVLLTEKGTGLFTHYGVVIGKVNNADFGEALWPFIGNNPWEYIYFLANITTVNIEKKELVSQLGYQDNFTVPGSIMVRPDQYDLLGTISKQYEVPIFDHVAEELDGKDYSALDIVSKGTRREGHHKFAKEVKRNYDYQCAVCGISETEFLVAGHVSPWAEDKDNRLNPSNGICFCSLHDKAFEYGYMALSKDYTIMINDKLMESSALFKELSKFNGRKIKIPESGKPDPELLIKHSRKHGWQA